MSTLKKSPIYSLAILLVLTIFGSTTALAQSAPSLTRYPYLQNVTINSAVIVWCTDVPSDSVVYYDTGMADDCRDYNFRVSDDTLTTFHALALESLKPDTRYYYCIESDGLMLAAGEQFHTVPSEARTAFTFGAISDLSWIPKSEALAGYLNDVGIEFLLHGGDVVHEEGQAELWDRVFFEPFRDILRCAPVYAVLGNHDLLTDNGQPFLDALVLPANNPEHSERYYSFDYGNAHFMALDVSGDITTGFEPGSPQYEWLIRDLKTTDKFWKIAFFHIPAYTSGEKYYGANPEVREIISPVLEKYGVDLVFNGHEDLYERTLPMHEFYDTGKGVVYVVLSAGDELPERGTNYWTAFVYSELDVRVAAIVDINGPVLKMNVIKTDGSIIDTLTLDRSDELGPTETSVPTTTQNGNNQENGTNDNINWFVSYWWWIVVFVAVGILIIIITLKRRT